MRIQRIVFALALAMTSAGIARAQDKSADAPAKIATVPLRVQVVISRYEGDKKVSSMPYMLSVNAGRGASLRMGSRVPIATAGATANMPTTFQYQEIGTSIDCSTGVLDDGRFRLELTIDDSSVDEQLRGSGGERPSLRSFRAVNSVVLKDGQTAQFTSAVDKVTGAATKVDVSVTVVK
jgi:hypothetical protein